MGADLKRRVARSAAVLAVALGAGHLVQNMGNGAKAQKVVRSEVAQKTTAIQTLAAGGSESLSSQPIAVQKVQTAPEVANIVLPQAVILPKAAPKMADAPPPAAILPAATIKTADACAIALDLVNQPNAMIGVTLTAPCQTNQRVVLQHAGLAITEQTTSLGSLFVDIPAMEKNAAIKIQFADGKTADATLLVPEIGQIRRFAVQWQANDAFQIHAFEDAGGYSGAGHVSGENPHTPTNGMHAKTGFLTLLGNSLSNVPLLAEVYTFPTSSGYQPEVVVEAAVTATACGREMLAETLISTGGDVTVTDLTLAMPACDAIGDYLVLKNLVPDLSIAAAN